MNIAAVADNVQPLRVGLLIAILIFREIPNRRKLRGAEVVTLWQVIRQILARISRSITTAAPGRRFLAVGPQEIRASFDNVFLGRRDDIKAVKNFIDQVQLGEVFDGRNQIIAVESWVLGAVVEKARQRLDVGGMAGSCWHEFGRIARLLPITRGMTQRTIEADARI